MKTYTCNFTVLIQTNKNLPPGDYSLLICGVEDKYFIDTITVYKKKNNVIFAKFKIEYEIPLGKVFKCIKRYSFTNPFVLIRGTEEIEVEYTNILFAPVQL